jgi:hypothetical protein
MLTIAIRIVREYIFVVGCTMHDADRMPVASCIWTADKTGKLTAEWKNSDGSIAPVSCAYNADKNAFVLTGDSDGFCNQNSGWEPVVWTSADVMLSWALV